MSIKNKLSFRIFLAVSVVLLLVGVVRLFGHNAVYHYDEEAAYQPFALSKGTYTISIYYDVNTDASAYCGIKDLSETFGSVKTNVVHFFSGIKQSDLEVWVYKNGDAYMLDPHVEAGDDLTLHGFTLRENSGMARSQLFILVLLLLLFWGGYLIYEYDKKFDIAQVDKNVAFGLLAVMLFACYPLMSEELLNSGDLVYHLMRIEGIKDGLLNGQFPVRIAPKWQQGYGYASSVFYGEALLYVGALLRMIGFSVMTSYRMLQVFLAAATVGTSYYCFFKMTKEKYAGLMGSMVYTLSVYRIYKTFGTGGLGETCAMIFLPFIAYGFFKVFTEDVTKKEYKKSFLPLTVGFCGLVQTHLLSGEMVGFFTVLLCIALWKKVFRKETFTVLAKTVIATCLVCAGFLVPFADYMVRGDFVIHHVADRTIQHRGLQVAQLFTVFLNRGNNNFYSETGMYHPDPESLGIVLVAALFFWCFLTFSKKLTNLSKEEKVGGNITAVFGVIAMVMSLSLFPWDAIQHLGGPFKTLVSSLQFPGRWLTVATLCLTVNACLLVKEFLKREPSGQRTLFFGGMLALVLVGNIYMINSMVYEGQFSRIYNDEGMGTGYISGAEYLPYGTDPSKLMPGRISAEDSLQITGYKKDGLKITLDCNNSGSSEAAVTLPLLYYRGYRAKDASTGAVIPIMDGNNHHVTLAVPAGYAGQVKVFFESPLYWRLAEAVSVLSLIGLILMATLPNKKGKKEK